MTDLSGKVRTFEIAVDVTVPLEGSLGDWPAKVQDAIYEALARKSLEVELPLAITHSHCETNPGEEEGDPDVHSSIVYASEIVMMDHGPTRQ